MARPFFRCARSAFARQPIHRLVFGSPPHFVTWLSTAPPNCCASKPTAVSSSPSAPPAATYRRDACSSNSPPPTPSPSVPPVSVPMKIMRSGPDVLPRLPRRHHRSAPALGRRISFSSLLTHVLLQLLECLRLPSH